MNHSPYSSYPHNPILAGCLFLTGDIERFGTGTVEMFDLMTAMQNGYIEMTIPDMPNHPNQKYRLTPKGLELKMQLEKTP